MVDRNREKVQQELALVIGERKLDSKTASARYAGRWYRLQDLPPAQLAANIFLWRLPKTKEDVQLLRKLDISHVVNCCSGSDNVHALLDPYFDVFDVQARDEIGYPVGYTACFLLMLLFTYLDSGESSG